MKPELEQLVEANRARLVRIARQYAAGDDWQDLLQEILLRVWKGLPGFKGHSGINTWLYRVAINTSLEFVRKRQLPTVQLDDDIPLVADDGDPLAVLDRFLKSLDPINRALLLMDLEGLSRDEICDVLGMTAGAVAVRMTRMKAQFADKFVEAR